MQTIAHNTTSPDYDDTEEESSQVKGYIGQYAWLSDGTRPDLAHSRMEFARMQNKCPKSCFQIMLDSGRYIKGTRDYGIAYYKNTCYPNQLIFYTDAGHNSCPITNKSIYCYIGFLNGGPIVWKVKYLEGKPSGSTFEAEQGGAWNAAREIEYLRMLLEEMGFPQEKPTTLYCDNESAVTYSTTGRLTPRNKNLDLKCSTMK